MLDRPFAAICAAAGVPKRLSTKVFRRTYNDLCRRAGVDEVVLRATIGHADRRMSEVYASVDPSEKRAGLARVAALVEA